MVQLSFDIDTLTEVDYDGSNTDYKSVVPLFDGVRDGFHISFPTTTTDADCKTAVKAKMTEKWVTRDTEI